MPTCSLIERKLRSPAPVLATIGGGRATAFRQRGMHQQLQELRAEFQSASERLHRLRNSASADAWQRRPAEDSWSAAECIAHLNLTSEAFLPKLQEAVATAGSRRSSDPPRYRHGFLGWLIWRMSRPTTRVRVKTGASFVPHADIPADNLVAEFERLQASLLSLLEQADNLPIHRVRIRSPFDERVGYSAYSAFRILPTHQHRHLQQAERALGLLTG
jgi:hypothetical protein